VRISAGGGTYADSFNNFWEADLFFTNANPTLPLTATMSEEAQPIWNTTDDQLYINEHATSFRYDIPIPNGNYTVRLHFAELFFNGPGGRVFSVGLEGDAVLSNFDIYALVGKNTALDRSFTVVVSDGILDISFTAQRGDKPVVNAILVTEMPPGS